MRAASLHPRSDRRCAPHIPRADPQPSSWRMRHSGGRPWQTSPDSDAGPLVRSLELGTRRSRTHPQSHRDWRAAAASHRWTGAPRSRRGSDRRERGTAGAGLRALTRSSSGSTRPIASAWGSRVSAPARSRGQARKTPRQTTRRPPCVPGARRRRAPRRRGERRRPRRRPRRSPRPGSAPPGCSAPTPSAPQTCCGGPWRVASSRSSPWHPARHRSHRSSKDNLPVDQPAASLSHPVDDAKAQHHRTKMQERIRSSFGKATSQGLMGASRPPLSCRTAPSSSSARRASPLQWQREEAARWS
mmetsp:Transcript_68653/g.200931  ORF Transcript_68653/g.200931 Transcript_68653/m.200931 type:complete len:301 (+) Transcript_68653:324-1226(+)